MSNVKVTDLFGARADPQLPELTLALDPVKARNEFKRRLPRLSGKGGIISLKAIRVTRHKPGRRCVVEYDVRVKGTDTPSGSMTLIGKIRARRSGNEGYRLLNRIWTAGFHSKSADKISVPKPIGVISRFHMWFQRKITGQSLTELLGNKNSLPLIARIADAIHKLHQAGVPTDRAHSMADELRILRQCLEKVAGLRPEWAARLTRITTACERLAATVPEPRSAGIHRDFYPAQVLIKRDRIYLIDFDLYCLGDPSLDVGNFIGHMTEQALREFGDARALAAQEQALETRFIELSGEGHRTGIRAYATLTLVRHIYLSTQFAERHSFTGQILKLCEQELGLG